MNINFSAIPLHAQAGLAATEVATTSSAIMVNGWTPDTTPPVVIDGTNATLTEAQVSALSLAAKSGYDVDAFAICTRRDESQQLLILLGEKPKHYRKDALIGADVVRLFPRIGIEVNPIDRPDDDPFSIDVATTRFDRITKRTFGSCMNAALLQSPTVYRERMVRYFLAETFSDHRANTLFSTGLKLRMQSHGYAREILFDKTQLDAFLRGGMHLSSNNSYVLPLPIIGSGIDKSKYFFNFANMTFATFMAAIGVAEDASIFLFLGGLIFYAGWNERQSQTDKYEKSMLERYENMEKFMGKHISGFSSDHRPFLAITKKRVASARLAKVFEQRGGTLNMDGYEIKRIALPRIK